MGVLDVFLRANTQHMNMKLAFGYSQMGAGWLLGPTPHRVSVSPKHTLYLLLSEKWDNSCVLAGRGAGGLEAKRRWTMSCGKTPVHDEAACEVKLQSPPDPERTSVQS